MSIENVRAYLKKYNADERIIESMLSSATVKDASIAFNCKEQEIAKSIALNKEDYVILIVCAGDTKIDNSKYKKYFGLKASMVSYEEVEEKVGHKAGGVCPFALKENVKVYLDESLKRFEYVYPACGSCNSAIKLSLKELEEYSNFECWVDVCKIKED